MPRQHGVPATVDDSLLELALRLVAGGAFLLRAPDLRFHAAFACFGWLLVLTTVGLLAIPWQWHARIAQRSVPHAIRHLRAFGVASLLLGVFVVGCAVHGAAR